MPAFAGLLLIYGCLSLALGSARRLDPGSEPIERGLLAIILGCWLIIATTYALLTLGLFLPGVVAGIGCALTLAGHIMAPSAGSSLLEATGKEVRTWSIYARAGVVVAALAVLQATARGVGHLPLGWDASSYHLVHAGRWVRDGAFTTEIHPDVWAYYEFFPTGGDVLWALLMLGDGTTDYLFIAALLGHVLSALGTYALFRSGELSSSLSALGTAAVLTSSPLLHSAAWLYVDGLLLGLATATTATAILAIRRASILGLLAASAGATATVAIKLLPLSLIALPALPLLSSRWQRRRALSLGVAALPLALILPGWIMRGAAFGDPLYPFGLPLIGRAEPLLAVTIDGSLPFRARGLDLSPGLVDVVRSLIEITTPAGSPAPSQLPFFGLLLPLAALGLVRVLRTAPLSAIALSFLALATTLPLLLPSSWGLLVLWQTSVGRFLLPAWVVVLIFTGRALPARATSLLLGALILVGLWIKLTHTTIDPTSIAIATATLGLLGSLTLLPWRHHASLWLGGIATSALALQVYMIVIQGPEHVATDRANPAIPITRAYEPVRARLALRESSVIATDFEFEPEHLGQDCMRFSLMGRWSQHRLITVSRWQSGRLHSTWTPPPDGDPLDERAWRERLAVARADFLYIQGRSNPTRAWAASDPSLELIETTEGYNALFRIHPYRAPSGEVAPDAPRTPFPEPLR